ncbi:hypothetical protein V8C42DRAFT_360407 [Trichoderma barbatum]
MQEEDSQAVLDRVLLTQWLDPDSLSLKGTYDELHNLHSLQRLVSHLKIEEEDNGRIRVDKDERQLLQKEANNSGNCNEEHANLLPRVQLQAIQRMEMQCELLRARAMTLSRPLIRPLHILDLPEEILDEIFSYLPDHFTTLSTKMTLTEIRWSIKGGKRRKDIQSVRLVCRLFNEVASPYLFPYLDVYLDMESLLRAERISKTAHLAKGVHGIRIGLQYRPKEMTTMSSLEASEDEVYEGIIDDGKDYDQAMRNRQTIDDAWNAYLRSEDGSATTEECLEYQQILVSGWQEFRRMHEEQLALIMDGTFTRILAESMARMPLSGNILLTDMMKNDSKFPDWFPTVSIFSPVKMNLPLL